MSCPAARAMFIASRSASRVASRRASSITPAASSISPSVNAPLTASTAPVLRKMRHRSSGAGSVMRSLSCAGRQDRPQLLAKG